MRLFRVQVCGLFFHHLVKTINIVIGNRIQLVRRVVSTGLSHDQCQSGKIMSRNGKERRGVYRGERLGSSEDSRALIQGKEYNYVLQIGEQDEEILGRYSDLLKQGAAHFAQVYYNYLHNNPETADVLFAFERSGGCIGDLVRSQLRQMFGIIDGRQDDSVSVKLAEIGRIHHEQDVRPVWIVGAYRLFLDHLQEVVLRSNGIDEADSGILGSALTKMVFRDLGMINDGYIQAATGKLPREPVRIPDRHDTFSDLMDNIPYVFWSYDVEQKNITFISHECGITDLSAESQLPCICLVRSEDHARLLSSWRRALNGKVSHIMVKAVAGAEGKRWLHYAFYPFHNRHNRILRVHSVMHDMRDLPNTAQQGSEMPVLDELTQLSSRAVWLEHLGVILSFCDQGKYERLAVIILDIDHFNIYNDALGYTVGDELLRQSADRLRAVVPDASNLGRLGGDEFGVVIPLTGKRNDDGSQTASAILNCFDAPYHVAAKDFCLAVSAGISIYPDHGSDADVLLKHAYSALHHADLAGIPCQVYDPGRNVNPVEQLHFSGQLCHALENQEFELHYQPQVEAQEARISGAEALLRWQHPGKGLVFPARFISVAERLGMIMPITDWVLITALRQCRRWFDEGRSVPVAVNMSARCFQSPGLFEKVERALIDADVGGEYLEIEITEATLMTDPERSARILTRLRDLGVTVAIDDFGTGYSSLSYLKRLPIHTLKIDRTFIFDVAEDKHDRAIVQSIIDLGHNLGYKVVAEGVESDKAWSMLNELGCDAVQGYHITRPLPESGFRDWLGKNRISIDTALDS